MIFSIFISLDGGKKGRNSSYFVNESVIVKIHKIIVINQLMFGINQLKTAALLGLLSGILVLVGYYLMGNEQGLYLGLAFAGISSFSSWYFSDRAVLATYQAQPLEREKAPQLYQKSWV